MLNIASKLKAQSSQGIALIGRSAKGPMRLLERVENFKILYCPVIFHIPCREFKIIHKRSRSDHRIRKLNLGFPPEANGLLRNILIKRCTLWGQT